MLSALSAMAAERGVTYTVPRTVCEARAQFRRLRWIPRSELAEGRRELDAIRAAMAAGGDAAAVREEELGGYGSNAHWR
jgi:hypothetical protein